jgi:capsular exopolysaccharide synthesis family protein
VAESFRLVQANLEFLGVDNHSRTILVTSPSQGNGKTTVAINLALSMAQSEQRVVLVDADMRRPAIHTALGIDQSPGLSEMIRSRKPIDATLQTWNDNILEVLTVGETLPNITQIAGSKKIASILDELKETFEVVIVDAPPLVISDAYNLASKVDGVILVLEPGQTSEEQAKSIKDQLDRAGISLIGVVFNKLSTAVAKSYGDYQYLSMYSPQQYSDYVSNVPSSRSGHHRSGEFMEFIEHGKIPPSVQSAITAIRTQPRNMVSRIKKKSRKNGRNDETDKAEEKE